MRRSIDLSSRGVPLICHLGVNPGRRLRVLASCEQDAPVPIWRVVRSFARRLRLSSAIAWLCGVVGGSLHRLFELDVELDTGKNLAHLGDVVL